MVIKYRYHALNLKNEKRQISIVSRCFISWLLKKFCFANWLSLFPSFLESVFVILNIVFLTSLFNINVNRHSFRIFISFLYSSSYVEKKFLAQNFSVKIFFYLLSYIAITRISYKNFFLSFFFSQWNLSIFSNISNFYSLNHYDTKSFKHCNPTIDNTDTTIIFKKLFFISILIRSIYKYYRSCKSLR